LILRCCSAPILQISVGPLAGVLPQALQGLSLGAVRGASRCEWSTLRDGGLDPTGSEESVNTLASRSVDRLTLHPESNVAEHEREPEIGRCGSCP